MTLKSRLATAAPAMVHNMISRRRPLVLRPVSPLKKGSMDAATMIGCRKNGRRFELACSSIKFQKTPLASRLKISFLAHHPPPAALVEKSWQFQEVLSACIHF